MSDEGGIFGMDAAPLMAMQEAIRAFPGDAESAINSVMHGEAGPMIYRRINPLINPSAGPSRVTGRPPRRPTGRPTTSARTLRSR